MLAGCGGDTVFDQVTIYSETNITIVEPNRPGPDRHELVLSCTTVSALFDFIDYGLISPGCEIRLMTYARLRSTYETLGGKRVRIYEFMDKRARTYYTTDAGR